MRPEPAPGSRPAGVAGRWPWGTTAIAAGAPWWTAVEPARRTGPPAGSSAGPSLPPEPGPWAGTPGGGAPEPLDLELPGDPGPWADPDALSGACLGEGSPDAGVDGADGLG